MLVTQLLCSARMHLLLHCMPLESTACLLLPHEREALSLAYLAAWAGCDSPAAAITNVSNSPLNFTPGRCGRHSAWRPSHAACCCLLPDAITDAPN